MPNFIIEYHMYMYVYLIAKEKVLIVTFVHMNQPQSPFEKKINDCHSNQKLNVNVMSKWNEGNFVE